MVVVRTPRQSTTWWCARCAPAIRGRYLACLLGGTRPRRTVHAPCASRALSSERWNGRPESVEIRVWDSSAEVRYLVLPRRPAGTEELTETALAGLVTRDSMIGVERL